MIKLLRGLWGLLYGIVASVPAALLWPYFAIKNNPEDGIFVAAFYFTWALTLGYVLSIYQTIKASVDLGFAASINQPFRFMNFLSTCSLFSFFERSRAYTPIDEVVLTPEEQRQKKIIEDEKKIQERTVEIQRTAIKQSKEIIKAGILPPDLLPIMVGYATEAPKIDSVEKMIFDRNFNQFENQSEGVTYDQLDAFREQQVAGIAEEAVRNRDFPKKSFFSMWFSGDDVETKEEVVLKQKSPSR